MKKLLISMMALALVLIGCNDIDESVQTTKGGHFRLSYQINGVISAASRAALEIEEGEDRVNSLYLLFFPASSSGLGQFAGAVDALQGAQLGSTGRVEIEFPAGLDPSQDYTVLFCANLEAYSRYAISGVEDLVEFCTGSTQKQVMDNLLLGVSGVTPGSNNEESDNSNRILSSNLPLYAVGTKKANQEEMSIELLRSLSRFDVYNQVNGYELVSASIWNAYTQTPLIEGGYNDFSKAHTERFYGINATGNAIVGGLYAFENRVEYPAQNDRHTTCLIVGLRKLDSTQTEYFRININATDMWQNLLRNNVYRTTVREVKGDGDDTERGAYGNSNLLVDIDINGWTLDDSGNLHYDGENILALPTNLINLHANGDERNYNIFSLGDETLHMTKENIPADVTATLDGNHLTIKAPSATNAWSGKLHFSYGRINAVMAVEQQMYTTDFVELSIREMLTFPGTAGEVSPAIQVNSSGDWVAEVYHNNFFTFVTGNPIESGVSGSTFIVQTASENHDNLRYSFVAVSLKDKPHISQLLVLEQESVGELPEIVFQSAWDYYGQLPKNNAYRTHHVQHLFDAINDQKSFGPSGTVKAKSIRIAGINPTHKAVFDETTIFMANMVTAAYAKNYGTWVRGNDKRVVIGLQDVGAAALVDNMAMAGYMNPGVDNKVAMTYGRTVNGVDHEGVPLTPDNNALYDYLFRSGPFTGEHGEINPKDAFFVPYDAARSSLLYSKCPATMIPIIMDKDQKYVILGVDPANRFIFCGEMELFGNKNGSYNHANPNNNIKYKTGSNYNNDGPHGPVNTILVNNLIAWMINVNKYGENFTGQFYK